MATEPDRRAVYVGERSAGTTRMFWKLSMRHEDHRRWVELCEATGRDPERYLAEWIRTSLRNHPPALASLYGQFAPAPPVLRWWPMDRKCRR